MKIAIFFDQNNSVGGGFQQSISDAKRFISLFSQEHEIFFYCDKKIKQKLLNYFDKNLNVIFINYKYNTLSKIFDLICYQAKTSVLISPFIRKIFKSTKFENLFKKNSIDLVYFLSPNIHARYLQLTLFFITVWDNCSRLYPELPEVRKDYRYELVENTIKTTLQKSSAIFVDSKFTLFNISKYYGIDKKKILVSGLNPSPDLSLEKIDFRKNLGKKNYICYPAQYWSHKNHSYIVYAIKNLLDKFENKIYVKFTGIDKGNENFIRQLVKDLNLTGQFSFCGYVSKEELEKIYSNSIALVMPSFYGPMNIPILDAIKIRLPVFYSSIYQKHIDFNSDEITFIDIENFSDLSNRLNELVKNPEIFYEKTLKAEKKFKNNESFDVLNLKKIFKSTSALISTYKK